MLTNAIFALALLQAGGALGTTPGQITIFDKEGSAAAVMPLEKTTVRAEATGMAARVTLVQTFTNPSTTPIEAIYTFPMSEKAAVDRMRVRIGDRIIEGEIKRRDEARRIYEAAKAAGQTASLLDQERPNIFTQSLANVMPGTKIEVEISYVEVLDYEDGQFEFSFPMVVGPRFIPGGVDDPDKISPPVTAEGKRSGAGIELSLAINSGGPLQTVESVLHAVRVDRQTNGAQVTLSRRDEIPNRDFICRWRPSGDGVQTGFYAQSDEQGTGGTFCLVFMPPQNPQPDVVRPKEMLFVMDQSGSQRGFPLDKSRELAKKMLSQLNRQDTFNIISFSDQPRQLWTSPQLANDRAVREATEYLDTLEANGGTMMLPAVRMAYKDEPQSGRLKIVVFNTDGFIGNEAEVLKEVQARNGQARMFTFGIGNGVNRYLIESMSLEGRGDSEIVTLAESADPAVERFIKRMRNPVLTDISIKAEGGLSKITPEFTPDVFGSKPVVVFGRYERAGRAKLLLSGKLGGQTWSKTMDVTLPAQGQDSSALPVLWARQQVADIARRAYGAGPEETKAFNEQIAQLGLAYGIMTSQTSFVAVEKRIVNIGGKQRTVEVPVDMTDGVSHDGVFGQGGRGRAVPGSPAAVWSRSGGGALGGGGFDSGLMRMGNNSPAEKISKKLNDKTGKLELMIRVDEITPELLEALKKAGFKLAEQDKGLKVVFGEADAGVLLEIAKIEQVLAIDPLE